MKINAMCAFATKTYNIFQCFDLQLQQTKNVFHSFHLCYVHYHKVQVKKMIWVVYFVLSQLVIGKNWTRCYQSTSQSFCVFVMSFKSKIWNASRICVSSLRRGHANLLCIVPILIYVSPRRTRLE